MSALPDALFDPASVGVVGASDNPEKWGYWLTKGALAGRGRRAVHLAVARAAAAHPELAELEVTPLLVHPGGAHALDAHGVLGAG
ncbi:hypothetical protein [Streptomyces sp. NPDC005799]|uniref:hypothetical protein n=1 Tax=Streptomyces sp. NPDC005799 TaxID=3154678 RepID=UPI0033CF1191